jgi:NADH:ubiquinone oxidoreductase subunit 5 (subunit L)/multisubunit Na+/H+ antiporter MnhA subunit
MEALTHLEVFDDDVVPVAPPKPRTLTVLTLLMAAAATFSYLGAFAATDALVKAEIMKPIRHHPDPRPLWAVIGFSALLAAFVLVAAFVGYLNKRQFRRIDAMVEAGRADE